MFENLFNNIEDIAASLFLNLNEEYFCLHFMEREAQFYAYCYDSFDRKCRGWNTRTLKYIFFSNFKII